MSPYRIITKAKLAPEAFRGPGTAFFTCRIEGRVAVFTEAPIVNHFRGALRRWLHWRQGRCDAYCFMPDHLHALLTGLGEQADLWAVMVRFKQETGAWLWRNRPDARWQRSFDARPLRPDESVEAVARYIHNNPVRGGLVKAWQDYPFTGCIEESPWLGARGPSYPA